MAQGLVSGFFASGTVILLSPGHAPSRSGEKEVRPMREFAAAVGQYSMGQPKDWLQRRKRVQKSAYAGPGERPTADDHYTTISLSHDEPLLAPSRVTILDDVVTSGATLYGCVRRVQTSFPGAEVLAFAIVRTMSLVPLIDEMVEPVENGVIELGPDGATMRRP